MDRVKQLRDILRLLKKAIPEPKIELVYTTPFELLTATVMSAQSTDVQVNKATKDLFAKYKSIEAFANAPLEELQTDISTVNFYKNKGSNIQKSANKILNEFDGEVPRTMAELITLHGVARKTANIILWGAYGLVEGIAVDTHVIRLSNLLGLTEHKDPVKIERDLMELTPKKQWPNVSHLLILHGRYTCKARKPMHDGCALYKICPSKDI